MASRPIRQPFALGRACDCRSLGINVAVHLVNPVPFLADRFAPDGGLWQVRWTCWRAGSTKTFARPIRIAPAVLLGTPVASARKASRNRGCRSVATCKAHALLSPNPFLPELRIVARSARMQALYRSPELSLSLACVVVLATDLRGSVFRLLLNHCGGLLEKSIDGWGQLHRHRTHRPRVNQVGD
jgi:hypothetical protein